MIIEAASEGKFGWTSELDEDTYKAFDETIKENEGSWESKTQFSRLISRYSKKDIANESSKAQKLLGVELSENEMIVPVHAYMEYGEGSKSIRRPILWFFVVNPTGIRRKYRVRFKGGKPDPTTATVLWQQAVSKTPVKEDVKPAPKVPKTPKVKEETKPTQKYEPFHLGKVETFQSKREDHREASKSRIIESVSFSINDRTPNLKGTPIVEKTQWPGEIIVSHPKGQIKVKMVKDRVWKLADIRDKDGRSVKVEKAYGSAFIPSEGVDVVQGHKIKTEEEAINTALSIISKAKINKIGDGETKPPTKPKSTPKPKPSKTSDDDDIVNQVMQRLNKRGIVTSSMDTIFNRINKYQSLAIGIGGHSSILLFKNREGAEKLAKVNQEMDPDWTYEVVQNNEGKFLVVIKDEDGVQVGTL